MLVRNSFPVTTSSAIYKWNEDATTPQSTLFRQTANVPLLPHSPPAPTFSVPPSRCHLLCSSRCWHILSMPQFSPISSLSPSWCYQRSPLGAIRPIRHLLPLLASRCVCGHSSTSLAAVLTAYFFPTTGIVGKLFETPPTLAAACSPMR